MFSDGRFFSSSLVFFASLCAAERTSSTTAFCSMQRKRKRIKERKRQRTGFCQSVHINICIGRRDRDRRSKPVLLMQARAAEWIEPRRNPANVPGISAAASPASAITSSLQTLCSHNRAGGWRPAQASGEHREHLQSPALWDKNIQLLDALVHVLASCSVQTALINHTCLCCPVRRAIQQHHDSMLTQFLPRTPCSKLMLGLRGVSPQMNSEHSGP